MSVGLIVVPLLARHIAAYDRRSADAIGMPRRLDIVGAALFGGTMVVLLLALTFVGQDASTVSTPTFWLMLTAGAASCLSARSAARRSR